ncbi:MAG: hypothetical protein TEF_13510 [Rhizobiales bacterium NRL2]|nr:MAG: hypothetical protein TEF_13510 [Rhizobiales bacterium NRL2]
MRSAMREEIARLKRERILEEARQLFFERGYQGTTLDAVAKRLEVTKPFIYSHFENKAALLGEISERGTARSLEAITRAHDREGDPKMRLADAVEEFVQVLIDHRANVAVYFREQQYVPEESARKIDDMRAEFDTKLAALIQEGVDKGQFRVRDVGMATLALGGMISWMYTWHRPGGRLSDAEVRANMLELVMNMLRASVGA